MRLSHTLDWLPDAVDDDAKRRRHERPNESHDRHLYGLRVCCLVCVHHKLDVCSQQQRHEGGNGEELRQQPCIRFLVRVEVHLYKKQERRGQQRKRDLCCWLGDVRRDTIQQHFFCKQHVHETLGQQAMVCDHTIAYLQSECPQTTTHAPQTTHTRTRTVPACGTRASSDECWYSDTPNARQRCNHAATPGAPNVQILRHKLHLVAGRQHSHLALVFLCH